MENNEHFIRNIEITDFKLFKDFKAEGFGRVNLIGGRNNVGKTAFMEACYLAPTNKYSKEYIEKSIVIELNRNGLDFLLAWLMDYENFVLKYEKSILKINENTILHIPYKIDIDNLTKNHYHEELKTFFKKNTPPIINNFQFISIGNTFNDSLVELIDEIKLANKETDLNNALENFFNIEKIDIIKNKVMLKTNNQYLPLSEYGDGVKHFLNIILSIYLNKNSILYIDEIENGIHYTNLDKLWEIILIISKEQNVQVFATTHSKECIESYFRVAKKLEDEDITMTTIARNPKDELKALVWNQKQFFSEMEQNHEVRR